MKSKFHNCLDNCELHKRMTAMFHQRVLWQKGWKYRDELIIWCGGCWGRAISNRSQTMFSRSFITVVEWMQIANNDAKRGWKEWQTTPWAKRSRKNCAQKQVFQNTLIRREWRIAVARLCLWLNRFTIIGSVERVGIAYAEHSSVFTKIRAMGQPNSAREKDGRTKDSPTKWKWMPPTDAGMN